MLLKSAFNILVMEDNTEDLIIVKTYLKKLIPVEICPQNKNTEYYIPGGTFLVHI